ncbi:hypothetical protein DPMN_028566 [Dreissena polymorpha]|uniref:Uncharacterized protein n=1 Tax=Dreissena polymorpha TaxID=45954 RepID=A0A9D4LZ67_DREPO|nr:hypothetical protein DPMN_028566 [Dreissena polymorpha]
MWKPVLLLVVSTLSALVVPSQAMCPASTTGLYCNQTCPQNCLNGVCNHYTARCEACANDWWGARKLQGRQVQPRQRRVCKRM